MGIDNVRNAELTTKDFLWRPRDRHAFAALESGLSNSHDKVLALIRPVGVTHPNFVFTCARDFDVLPDRAASGISAGGHGIPFTLAALRPFGRHAGTADGPAGSFGCGNFQIGGIQLRFMP